MPNQKLGNRLLVRKLLVISTLLAGTTLADMSRAQPNDRNSRDRVIPRGERMMERHHPCPEVGIEVIRACVAVKGSYSAAAPERIDHFAAADGDGDGFLSKEEFVMQRAVDLFARMDTDGDGQLSTDARTAQRVDRRIQSSIVRECRKQQRNPRRLILLGIAAARFARQPHTLETPP